MKKARLLMPDPVQRQGKQETKFPAIKNSRPIDSREFCLD
ncbi:hypothetical protein CLOM621_07958 [Clostridium sp. M62/1]|nr:hypothetical protein CLOM621_07958 [Clostridium sp. M62/1]